MALSPILVAMHRPLAKLVHQCAACNIGYQHELPSNIFKFGVRHFRGPRKVALPTKDIKWTPQAKEVQGVKEAMSFGHLLRPLAFTVGFCGVSFVGASVWQYENMRSYAARLKAGNWTETSPRPPLERAGSLRRDLNAWWGSLPEPKRVALAIISANVTIFAMWRIPRLQPVMIKWFTSNPASRTQCIPMVLSAFSHYNTWHLAANMYVLWSFSMPVIALMGKEQFVAVYMSAGVVSSFTSLLYKTTLKIPGMSLGASGAIMAMIGITCVEYPNAMLSIILLPTLTFTAANALKGILLLDAVGAAMRWKVFDHAAHLGGALFGVWYLKYGHKYTWHKRSSWMSLWHRIRGNDNR